MLAWWLLATDSWHIYDQQGNDLTCPMALAVSAITGLLWTFAGKR